MKKNNKLGKFAVFVLLITIIAVILVANTYAKYITSKDLEAVATVAKWSIKLGGKDITQNEAVTFDLFTTKDTDGSDETDVSANRIAPGTQGSFDVELENASEVSAKYTVTFESQNTSNIPVEFSVDGGKTWKTDIKELTLTDVLEAGAKTSTTESPKISWRWVFERGTEDSEKTINNGFDTDLGTVETAPTVTVTAHLVAEQVD